MKKKVSVAEVITRRFLRVVVLLIPLSIAGSILLELEGLFWRRLATDLLNGLIGIW